MMEDPAPDPKLWNPAHAEITQVGRWKYSIHISHGFMRIGGEYGGPHRYGRERAAKYARRYLAKYLRDEERRQNRTRVTIPAYDEAPSP